MTERTDLERQLTLAVESALRDYLVASFGQDLAEDQLLLTEYRFDVEALHGNRVIVRAKHDTDCRWALMFGVDVAAI